MKQLFLSFFMSMFAFGMANAQLTFLLEGGANYGSTKITENDIFDSENIVSYYVAVTPKLQLLSRLNAFGEFQYSVEGANVEPLISPDGSLKYRQHYIRIIPGIEVNLLKPLSVIAGLNMGFATVTTAKDTQGSVFVDTRAFEHDKSDYGLLLGANLNINAVNLVIKYNYGLDNVNELNLTNIDGDSIGVVNFKNRFLQVGIGYEFGI